MRPYSKKSVFVILVVIAALAGYAGRGMAQSATPKSSGESTIAIEASNHKFSPNKIRVEKPGQLTIEVKNVSGSEHNFTLKDSSGKILKSVDFRSGASVTVNVQLPEPGVYKFYCDKPLHSTLGMNGQIIVGR